MLLLVLSLPEPLFPVQISKLQHFADVHTNLHPHVVGQIQKVLQKCCYESANKEIYKQYIRKATINEFKDSFIGGTVIINKTLKSNISRADYGGELYLNDNSKLTWVIK